LLGGDVPARTIIEELVKDHDEVRDLLSKIEASTGKQRKEQFQRLVAELVRHEVAEAEILRPVSRKVADERIANARIKEESEAEQMLKKLEKLDPSTAEFEREFSRLAAAVEEHAESEETKEFPRVEEGVPRERLEQMARAYDGAKALAPTHPHPSLPNTPAANLLVGPFVAVADRARDAVRKALEKVAG
jgi:iron-sulfur cluster repair protein YtfE (RIC family)